MAQVIITINYREYPISCENGEELRIIKLGQMLDEKAQSLTKALGHINENQLLAMVGLLIADELNDTKKELTAAQENKATQPAATPEVSSNNLMSEKMLTDIDNALEKIDIATAEQINSLNQDIKSVALKLKSV